MSHTTTLYYREGKSDKVYQAGIVPFGQLYNVEFAYGRRGSTMSTGVKNARPVSLEEARNIYEKLLREKKAKGYTEGPDGTPYRNSAEAGRVSSWLPQLLNPIAEEEAAPCLAGGDWAMQEKFDGKRLLIWKQGGRIEGINRKGLLIGLPAPLHEEAKSIDGDFVLDGEAVVDRCHAFDLLMRNGRDFRGLPYRDRLAELSRLAGGQFIIIAETFLTPESKRRQFEALKRGGHEGVVFKDLNAVHTAGRPNSGGTQLKCKFYATASFVAGGINEQRSIRLTLLKDGDFVPVGNVTVPPNQAIPKVEQVVDVRFLYAFRESHTVYQPTLLRIRDDIDPEDCTIDQLQYKPLAEDER